MPHAPKLAVAVLAAAGLTTIALTGCTAKSPAALPPTSAPAEPASSPSTPAATSPSRTASTAPGGQSGQGGSADWSDVDFEKVMFVRLGCPDFPQVHRRAEVLGLKQADLTGDGHPEAVVAGACSTTTSANPAQVIVFDGAHIANPRPLVAIGTKQDLVSATVQLKGRTVKVTSQARSAKTGLCCPDLLITQTYAWQGEDGFVRVLLEEKKLPA